MNTHRDLIVWKKSIDFVTKIYKLTERFPKTEMYGLTSQIRRAAVSIPSNIAEGSARDSDKELVRFLTISRASAAEIETQLLISDNLGYLESTNNKINEELIEILKMLTALINTIKQRI
jgi:four helix bundle protein|tara:strand:- start:39 stop:395 length:357 start_codon:yes stop_codon:yes gene_type:complete